MSEEKKGSDQSWFVLWLMGPTSSGKTTISEYLAEKMQANGTPVIHYDGDEVRNFFGDSLRFASSDRLRVVETLTHLANKASQAGLNVIISALTANEDARQYVRNNTNNLITVYVKCSIDTCTKRDPKGFYAQALKGEISTLIGINSEYYPPEAPDIVIDTEVLSVEESAQDILDYVTENNWL